MKIYDGGSDKYCCQLNVFTGNTLPSTISSYGNQMFISYTNNGDGAPGKGFSASFTFGKKVTNFSKFKIICNFFALLTDNLCDNALDLTNKILNVDRNWPNSTYCQWMISSQHNNGYVILEFQSFNVRKSFALKE